MFLYLPSLFKKFFGHLVANAKRRREARYAEHAARRRQTRFVHLRLEDLEERIVPDAYVFAVNGNPSVGAYTDGTLWTNLRTNGNGVPGAADTEDIPSGAVCTLDSTEDQSIAGLTVEGKLTTQSMLTVAPGGSGTGTTSVASGGLLDVAAADKSGVNSTLDTTVLSTATSGGTNLSIDDGAAVDIASSGSLMGNTSLTGHLTAKNINASSGATVALGGTGAISGNGQLDAEIQSSIDFTGTWTILPGSPVGSALKAGNFIVDGTLDLDTNIEPFGDLTLDPGGTIGGSAELTVGQTLNWLGGTLTPAGGTEIIGELNASGPDTKTLSSDLQSDTLTDTLGGAGTLFISPGATFLDSTGYVDLSLPLIYTTDSGTFAVSPDGHLNALSSSSAPTTISSNFTNDGNLDVPAGDGLTLENPGESIAIVVNGQLGLEGDLTLLRSVSTTTGFIVGAGGGSLKIGDGPGYPGMLTIPSGEEATLSGGELEVSDNGTLTGGGEVSNTSGTLAVDLGGSTTGLGSYAQSASGALSLQAMNAYTYSSLGVSGEADLAGTLNLDLLDGYTPSSGVLFTLLTAGTVNNEFNTTPPNMTPTYTSTSVTLSEN